MVSLSSFLFPFPFPPSVSHIHFYVHFQEDTGIGRSASAEGHQYSKNRRVDPAGFTRASSEGGGSGFNADRVVSDSWDDGGIPFCPTMALPCALKAIHCRCSDRWTSAPRGQLWTSSKHAGLLRPKRRHGEQGPRQARLRMQQHSGVPQPYALNPEP
jgi:hypothetical protein